MHHNISHEHFYAPAFSQQYGKHQRCKICGRTKKFIESEGKKHSYFNTTNVSGAELDEYESKAATQDMKILAYFVVAPFAQHTPSSVLRWVFNGSVPITSVRRALTNLTDAGELVKTNLQTKGPYGRPEHYWRLVERSSQRELF